MNLKKQYSKIVGESFPESIEMNLGGQVIRFEKVRWKIKVKDDKTEEEKEVDEGLRYGDNPGQEAALYRPVNMNVVFGDVRYVHNGELVGRLELLQSGKHPGKTNITDIDSGLNILKYFDEPTCVIIKHNNPCGVSSNESLLEAYIRAYQADVVASFGGVVALNKALNREVAEALMEQYFEVVVAPEYEEGVLEILSKRKNLRVAKIGNMNKLQEYKNKPYIDFKTLMDGSLIIQQSYVSRINSKDDLMLAEAKTKEKQIRTIRKPTEKEYEDMIFGWHVLEGVTSNSSLFAKDKTTIAIATGEQDRVGGIKIAIMKAYEKYVNKLAKETYNKLYDELSNKEKENVAISAMWETNNLEYLNKLYGGLSDSERGDTAISIMQKKGNLKGSILATDGFMPNRDNILAIAGRGINAVIQPGGSMADFEVIEEANKYNIAMVFTGQRCFRH